MTATVVPHRPPVKTPLISPASGAVLSPGAPGTADLAFRLKDHVYKMLFNNLRNEISWQIEDVWGAWFDDLVVAQDNAARAQQRALQKAQRAQEEYERMMERAFAVLNFFYSAGINWFGAILELRVGAHYFRKHSIHQAGFAEGYKLTVVDEKNEFAAKVFGDTGKEVAASLGTFTGLSSLHGPSRSLPPEARDLAESQSLEEFRRKLKRETVRQKNHALGEVERICNDVQGSVEFGEKLLAAVQRQNPGMASMSLAAQEHRGQMFLNDWLNGQRKRWAGEWPCYGNNPPNREDVPLEQHMQKELWVLWLVENKKMLWHSLTDINAGRLKWFESIVEHLNGLNLPVIDLINRRGRNRDEDLTRLILWALRRKPENVLASRPGAARNLTAIENWSRRP